MWQFSIWLGKAWPRTYVHQDPKNSQSHVPSCGFLWSIYAKAPGKIDNLHSLRYEFFCLFGNIIDKLTQHVVFVPIYKKIIGKEENTNFLGVLLHYMCPEGEFVVIHVWIRCKLGASLVWGWL